MVVRIVGRLRTCAVCLYVGILQEASAASCEKQRPRRSRAKAEDWSSVGRLERVRFAGMLGYRRNVCAWLTSESVIPYEWPLVGRNVYGLPVRRICQYVGIP